MVRQKVKNDVNKRWGGKMRIDEQEAIEKFQQKEVK